MAKAPTKTFIERCDTKLWDEDWNAEGRTFASAEYEDYLAAVSERRLAMWRIKS
jgi:hypothetical protein